jgi:hypothetical protein
MAVRSTLPAQIQAIMQNGLLDRTFQDALLPQFLFPMIATNRPWQSNLGDTVTFTRTGLLSPVTAPLVVGNDPSPSSYSVEQYSMTMDQYANSVDTNMLQSAMTLASKFLEDQQKLAINAGQSLNRIARNKLFAAYGGGRTWVVTAQGSASTTCVVNDATGFTTVLVNGVPTPVSGANPLSIKIAGVANTVTAVNTGTNTLTLGTAVIQTVGQDVVAATAPVSYRPAARASAFNLTGTDTATFSMFLDAVARLRNQNVPSIGGYYVAHIDSVTQRQLFADADFKQALQGRVDSPVYRDLSIGRFGGIDWVRNEETPTMTVGSVTVRRPIVVGADALIQGPFSNMGNLLAEAGNIPDGEIRMVNGIALITRPPQDRLQQVLASTWSWVGDYAVPTDSMTGDASMYKRAVVIEHAS